MWVKLLKLFKLILLSPLILCIGIIVLLIVLFLSLRDRVRYKRFCRSHNNEQFLVCTTRHGWKNFLENNVIPTLPQTVIVEWNTRRYRNQNPVNLCDFFWARPPKPFFARITLDGIKTTSLNDTLQTLKKSAKRDVMVQRQVRSILEEKLREFSAM